MIHRHPSLWCIITVRVCAHKRKRRSSTVACPWKAADFRQVQPPHPTPYVYHILCLFTVWEFRSKLLILTGAACRYRPLLNDTFNATGSIDGKPLIVRKGCHSIGSPRAASDP